MKNSIAILMAVLSLALAGFCGAADQTLMEWSFAGASDTLGWTPAGGKVALDRAVGALSITGSDSKLISPLFEIKATPWQFVEIEMKSDKDGIGRLFYSNTTEEPYGGFRGELQAQFHVLGDGQFRKYAVLPCWQSQGKVIHIRIDPAGENSAVKSVRIVGPEPDKSATTEWKFADTAAGWRAFGADKDPTPSRTGWTISGTRNTLALSPALDLAAGDAPVLTLRIASPAQHNVLFRWISSDRDGVQSVPIEVRGGGSFHSYTMDLSAIGEWSGRISAIGVTPTDGTDAAAISVESVAVAKGPVGPAEIRINRLALADPATRAGERAKVVVEIENIGGAVARSATAIVTLVSGDTPKALPVKSVDRLPPGKTALLEWETKFDAAGAVSAASSASADRTEPDQKQAIFQILPMLDPSGVKSTKRVPEPRIADTGEYQVGCYYFPGWRDYGAWSVLNDFPERKPILGYAHDGNPEVVDWQINWALSHGISFFIYDWYWSKGSRRLEEGLHDGFFKARLQDKMGFCLLWANHNGPGTHSEQDMLDVTKYWIENYFKRPNYLKLNGKNVMVIFNPAGITQDMGVDGARAAFAKMKKMCDESGAGGLYLVACSWQIPERIKQMEEEGYDAFSGYNYPSAGCKGLNVAPYEWMVNGYKEIWGQIADAATRPYIPLCEAGWDSRPWHGPNARVRTGKSAELWQKMLSNAKAFTDDPARKLPEGKKLVFCEAWNEFGEGDYVEPTAGDGFSYVEAVRRVFAPSSKQPTILLPKDLGMGPYEIAPPVFQTAWNFSKPADRVWTSAEMTLPTYDSGALTTEATGGDPRLSALWVEIDTAKYKKLEVKMRIDKPGEAQLFFARKREGMDEAKTVRFPVVGDGEFHTYTVDMAANSRWSGIVTALRLDPTSVKGAKIEIAGVEFRE